MCFIKVINKQYNLVIGMLFTFPYQYIETFNEKSTVRCVSYQKKLTISKFKF